MGGEDARVDERRDGAERGGAARVMPFPPFGTERRWRAALAAWRQVADGALPAIADLPAELRRQVLPLDDQMVPPGLPPGVAAQVRGAAAAIAEAGAPIGVEAWLPAVDGGAARWRGLLLPGLDGAGRVTAVAMVGRLDATAAVGLDEAVLSGLAGMGALVAVGAAPAPGDRLAQARTWAALAAAGPLARERNLALALGAALEAARAAAAPTLAEIAAVAFAPLPDPVERTRLGAALHRAADLGLGSDRVGAAVAAWPGGLAGFAAGAAPATEDARPALRLLPVDELLPPLAAARATGPAALAA